MALSSLKISACRTQLPRTGWTADQVIKGATLRNIVTSQAVGGDNDKHQMTGQQSFWGCRNQQSLSKLRRFRNCVGLGPKNRTTGQTCCSRIGPHKFGTLNRVANNIELWASSELHSRAAETPDPEIASSDECFIWGASDSIDPRDSRDLPKYGTHCDTCISFQGEDAFLEWYWSLSTPVEDEKGLASVPD